MSLKDLSERLGLEYSISADKEGTIQGVSIHADDVEKTWEYRKPIDFDQIAGLFREVYTEAIEKLVESDKPFFLDNLKK